MSHGGYEQNHLWPVSSYQPSPTGSAWVTLARTSEPPCFSVIAMPHSAPPRSRGSHSAAISGSTRSAGTAEYVIETGHITPALACVHMNSSAARATCAPGRGSAHGERRDPARQRALEQPVPGGIELDLVDARAEAVERDQSRLVALGTARVGLGLGRGRHHTGLPHSFQRPAGALALQCLAQRGVSLQQVDVFEGNGLIGDFDGHARSLIRRDLEVTQ